MDFTIETSLELKKANCLINFQKFRGQPILKVKFVFWPRKGQTWQLWTKPLVKILGFNIFMEKCSISSLKFKPCLRDNLPLCWHDRMINFVFKD